MEHVCVWMCWLCVSTSRTNHKTKRNPLLESLFFRLFVRLFVRLLTLIRVSFCSVFISWTKKTRENNWHKHTHREISFVFVLSTIAKPFSVFSFFAIFMSSQQSIYYFTNSNKIVAFCVLRAWVPEGCLALCANWLLRSSQMQNLRMHLNIVWHSIASFTYCVRIN